MTQEEKDNFTNECAKLLESSRELMAELKEMDRCKEFLINEYKTNKRWFRLKPGKVTVEDIIKACFDFGWASRNQFNGGVWLDYLEPIPLTPEILEKNGFRLTKADTVCPADRYWWAIDGTRDGAMVEITLYNPDVHGVKVLTKIYTQSSHESGVNTVHSCDIESVHELQHALRLCRIDKEIVV